MQSVSKSYEYSDQLGHIYEYFIKIYFEFIIYGIIIVSIKRISFGGTIGRKKINYISNRNIIPQSISNVCNIIVVIFLLYSYHN